MPEDHKNTNEKINTELSGMGLYGTTGNVEIEGYEASGDIENAGRLDKGFKKKKEHMGAKASLKESP